MSISIRTEKAADHAVVAQVVQAAFAEMEHSDQQEHLLIERLRHSAAFVPELSLVAEQGQRVIGYILLTEIRIENTDRSYPGLALAPVAVLPAHQNKGIGGRLIAAAHTRATALGYTVIVLIGHEEYYPRFGYEPCALYNLRLPFPVPPANAMVLGLVPGALDDVSGEVQYDKAFFA